VILEGLVTTRNADRSINISPMGAVLGDSNLEEFDLRPFRSARTYENLHRTRQGILHVTDDVEMLARAAVDRLDEVPAMQDAEAVDGAILTDACRWYAFQVVTLDDTEERTHLHCRVIDQGLLRHFLGFNRAKHAVLEAAILATRVHLIPAEAIRAEMQRLSVPVEKTAGPQERRAFAFLQQYLQGVLTD
jgi:hypothetical protein